MDERKDFLATAKMCRFCLSQDELSELYENHQGSKRTIPFALKILSTVSVEIFPSDSRPPYICSRCKYFMGVFHDYKQLIRGTDEAVYHYVQSDTQLEPKPWPKSLGKIFRLSCKTKPKTTVMKTVVEGGATIEVTQSQEASESEDGEEDLYKVKIEDGSQELKSATVKVVTAKEEPGEKNNRKDSEFELDTPAKVTASSSCWACDECESSYPLHQLLELHKMKKHRNRLLPCTKCSLKFSSMQDLENHMTIKHTCCAACGLSFQQVHHLRRHERFNHPELLTHKCRYCPEVFLTEEVLQEHLKRHKRYLDNTLACDGCDKRFIEETTLRHHQESAHSNLVCEYCPQRFNSVTKLGKHLRTHAGEKQYPCKYCNKAFVKSHHYTRHLRVKHANERIKQDDEPDMTADNYQCEQCGSSFTSQDDLIYHSAIHATQNLICPLCQEKFEDVDSVTAHIKSHVPDMEYQCDFCELVFTSKNKLELHLIAVHEDQLQQDPDEYSMDIDDEEDDAMNIKQDGDDMIVEIKKPDDFLITNPAKELQEIEEYDMNNSQSDDSDHEPFGQETDSPKPNFGKPVASPAKTFAPLETVPASPTLYSAPTTPTAPVVPKTIPAPAPVTAPTVPKGAPASITPVAPKAPATPDDQQVPPASATIEPKTIQKSAKIGVKSDVTQSPGVLRKTEEVKRKVTQQTTPDNTPEKKEKSKVESSGGGASDKSLRLLEKELQELKRTNTRNESPKSSAKAVENLRNRRPQIHTSTPKLRSAEEKKPQAVAKSTPPEKKVPERRAVKENKKPEESKEAKNNSIAKEDKDAKQVKEKEVKKNIGKDEPEEKDVINKDKEDSKEKIVKNGNKSCQEEGVRRSSRPSRIKDYAKMIRDRTEAADSDDDTDDDDEEYELKEDEKTPEARTKRKSIPKQKAQSQPVKVTPIRKRGRPRKDLHSYVPAKMRKEESEEDDSMVNTKAEVEDNEKEHKPTDSIVEEKNSDSQMTPVKADNSEKKPDVLVSPSGQTLKKVPIKSLPPGIKPMPLPANARPVVGTSETCEMQIGKKVVKVQKIVMTKAEVEAMAKKGLLEMKDGTMVLKPGIKLATTDAASLKSTLVGEEIKESPVNEKAVPTRCNLDEE